MLITLAIGWGVQVSVPPIVFAADLPEIRQRGYLMVAVKDNLRPLGFRTDRGELEGLEIDLAHRLAESLFGRSDAVRFYPVRNQDRLTVLLDEEVDIVIARMTMTESRSRTVDFSLPYYLDGTALITRNPTIGRWVDLQSRSVAVLRNSSTIAVLRSRLPASQLVEVMSYQEAREQLEQGLVSAFAADSSVLAGWVQELPGYALLPTRLSGEPLAIAMPRGTRYGSLRQHINRAIDQWREQGWLQERVRYWGLPQD